RPAGPPAPDEVRQVVERPENPESDLWHLRLPVSQVNGDLQHRAEISAPLRLDRIAHRRRVQVHVVLGGGVVLVEPPPERQRGPLRPLQPRLHLLPLVLQHAERDALETVPPDLVRCRHAGRGYLAPADPPRYWCPRPTR